MGLASGPVGCEAVPCAVAASPLEGRADSLFGSLGGRGRLRASAGSLVAGASSLELVG